MVLRTEPLVTPLLTATAGRHTLVTAAHAMMRGGASAVAIPRGSAGGVGSARTWSRSPAVVRQAGFQGWVVAADAPTAFQPVQPLLQAIDDLVQQPGLAPGDVQLPLGGDGDLGDLDHLRLGDVQLLLCARSDPGKAYHFAFARVYLSLEGLDPPAEVDNPPPGGFRVTIFRWALGVRRGSSRRPPAGPTWSRGSSATRRPASGVSTWWTSSRGS